MHPATLIGSLGMTAPVVWMGLRSSWESFAQSAGPVLITSIWQSLVLVCGLELALWLMPRTAAAHRFALWASGFGIAAALPLLAWIHLGAGGSGAGAAGSVTPARAVLEVDSRWGLAIAGLWLAASAVRFAVLMRQALRLRQLWRAADPVRVEKELAAVLKGVHAGQVSICTTALLDRPSVIGFLQPRILIPAWLLGRLSSGELEQIVLHEAEHLRRHDDWMNLLQKLALVLFPLNPALAWIEHRLCREREMACDEGVVRITNAPRAYAACLASLAERRLERRAEALSLGAWHKRSELAHRVHGILLRRSGMSRAWSSALVGTVGCALLAATLAMARCPELIAFVPPEHTALVISPARQQQLAALLARESEDSKPVLPPGYRALAAKAVLSQAPGQRGAAAHASETRAAALKSNARRPSPQVAKAERAGDRVNGPVEQQWVVLSAWEEVRTIVRRDPPDQVADYDLGAAPTEAAAQDKSKSEVQPGTTYTVTQLILRIVPANPAPDSAQPPSETLRGSWFVIQL